MKDQSSFGTLVNGQKIVKNKEHVLQPDDVLKFGTMNSIYRFVSSLVSKYQLKD